MADEAPAVPIMLESSERDQILSFLLQSCDTKATIIKDLRLKNAALDKQVKDLEKKNKELEDQKNTLENQVSELTGQVSVKST